MGKFNAGRVKTGGRQKGTPNKWKFPEVEEICRQHNYDPLIELIKARKKARFLATKIKIDIAILPYTRPKPKIDIDVTGGLFGQSNPLRSKSAEDLIQLLPVTNAQSKADRSTATR